MLFRSALFSGVGDDSNMPTTILSKSDIPSQGISILDLMTACKLAPSKAEARRLIQQGGISIDGEKVDTIEWMVEKKQLVEGIKIRKGKKVFHKVKME